MNNQEELVINAKINTKQLVKRSKVVLDLNVTIPKGDPFPRPFNGRYRAGQVVKGQNSETVLTQLLLESILRVTLLIQGCSLLIKKEQPFNDWIL